MGFEFNLDNPNDVLYMAKMFMQEWYNGGLSQLYGNWEPSDAKLIPDGLRAIGAVAAADVVATAIAELGPQEEWQDRGHYALLHPNEPLSERLQNLDRQLDQYSNHIDSLIDQFDLKLNGDGLNSLGKGS